MLTQLLVVCLFAVAFAFRSAGPTQTKAEIEGEFLNYIKFFNKPYSLGDAEYGARLLNYKASLVRIADENQRSKHTTFAVNHFSDLSADEFKSTILTKPVGAPIVARSCLANGVTLDDFLTETDPTGQKMADPPASFDWRTKGVVTPVKNQGACGSCWTFSTTGSIESGYAIKHGNLIQLSEQEIVDCSTACVNEPPYGNVCNSGCNGGWQWGAMADVTSWGGLATETQYPYQGVTGQCQRTSTMKSAPIANYTCLSGGTIGLADETKMKAFLAANGPLSIALDATPLQDYSSGVVDPWSWSPFGCSQTEVDHAVLIVGYGTYESDLWGAQPMWIVKNSWGADWGLDGYFMIYRGTNMCGLAVGVVFPIVK